MTATSTLGLGASQNMLNSARPSLHYLWLGLVSTFFCLCRWGLYMCYRKVTAIEYKYGLSALEALTKPRTFDVKANY